MNFERHDRIKHVTTGRSYMVLAGPVHGVRIEATGNPGYLYQEYWVDGAACIWACDAEEMEDGRFDLDRKTTHGAHGRFPED